jgi:acetate---CoA ligase (ADP-forming)
LSTVASRSSDTASRPLGRLLAPRSVAVIGASATTGKAGNALMGSLASFPGPVYAVNPRGDDIAGRPGAARVADIPGQIDLALIAVPAQAVPGVLAECAEAKIGGAVVHSGGWAEAGAEGVELQASLLSIGRDSGLRILGPNTSGFFDPAAGLCATFVRPAADLPAGGLAIVAQSGGVNHALAFLAAGEGLGIRLGVGLGNAADVGFADILSHLSNDETVQVVALAIEGVDDGRRLVEAIEQLAAQVPVVALKTGRTDVDAFSRSHTGALTGSWRVTRAALAQAGAVVMDDMTQLVDAAQALRLVRLPVNAAPGVGVVTGQAGPGLLLADELGVQGVQMPELPQVSIDRLGELLPPITFQRNPVDTGRPAETFGSVLETVGSADGIDLLAVYLLEEPDAVDPVELLGATPSPSVLSLTATVDGISTARTQLAESGVPVLPTPERCARAVAAVVRDAVQRARRAAPDTAGGTIPAFRPNGAWDEDAAKALIAELGLTSPARVICTTHAEARAALAALGPPVAVKVLHPEIEHKTEAGGVHLGITDDESLGRALEAIDRIEGARYLIEEMAPSGPELILGARRDPAFGPVVALGSGGTAVEAADDASVRIAPVGAADAAAMLDELAGAAAYRGARGAPAVDDVELTAAIVAFGNLIAGREDIAEVEVNPLRVTRSGLVALDALVVDR